MNTDYRLLITDHRPPITHTPSLSITRESWERFLRWVRAEAADLFGGAHDSFAVQDAVEQQAPDP
ncbi:MAG: hypothetical protein WCT12_12545, partial [Verrucomicrobiota bacterium]